MDSTIFWLTLSLVTLVFSGLFSGCEIAYVSSERVRTELDVKKGGITGRILNLFYGNSEMFISTILVGNNIMLVIYGMGAAALLEPLIEAHITDNDALILLIQTIVSTLVILLMGEFLPKSIFRINPNRSVKLLSLPMVIFYIILYPVSLLTTWLSRVLMRLAGIHDHDVHLLGAISEGDLNNYLERTIDSSVEHRQEVEHEVKFFHNALDFSTIHLRDCMIPRNEIVAVNIDTTTRDELSELFTTSGRSKIIVYRGDIDTVLGYIHVSELFVPERDWRECLKPVLFAPETLLSNKMMRRLLTEKRSLAIVVDEFGGTSGMVTLEDLVEEIFGDIRDEHDTSGPEAREIAPGVYELGGRMEIEQINETYHLGIPEDDEYQTLAGYILHSTGCIPDQGAVITLGDLSIQVIRKSAARLELLRVTRIAPTAPESTVPDAVNQ